MTRGPRRGEAEANDYRLSAGLLKAHIVDRVPIDRLAADYGFTPERLRTRLLDHVAACFVAIGGAITEPEAAAVAPPAEPSPAAAAALPAVRVRVRERVQRAPLTSAERPRIRAVRSI